MQTQKMSLANIQGKLNRNEMKNIMAGVAQEPCHTSCTCTGSVGAWDYLGTNPILATTLGNDIKTYCSSGSGSCTCVSLGVYA